MTPFGKKTKNTKAIYTDFDEWFIAQFGPRPNDESLLALSELVKSRRNALRSAEDIFRSVERWEDDRNAAMLGWNGKGFATEKK